MVWKGTQIRKHLGVETKILYNSWTCLNNTGQMNRWGDITREVTKIAWVKWQV